MNRKIFFVLIVPFILACNSSVEEGIDAGYFDSVKFVEELFERGDSISSVLKIVNFDGQKEQKSLVNYSVNKELKLIEESNINKPGFAGKYDISSEQTADTIVKTYIANDSRLRIRKIRTVETENNVVSLEISTERKSILAHTTSKLLFEPGVLFRMYSLDNNRFMKDHEKEVLLHFENN